MAIPVFMKILVPYSLILVLLTSCKESNQTTPDISFENDLSSRVFTLDSAQVINEDFGVINLFTNGESSTYGTKNVTTGILSILPNNEAHPPHKHAEEEYLVITKGSGTWSVNGKEFSAQAGDLLYAAPWDLHGIFNSDTVNLEFYFVKWNNKGLPLPVEN